MQIVYGFISIVITTMEQTVFRAFCVEIKILIKFSSCP